MFYGSPKTSKLNFHPTLLVPLSGGPLVPGTSSTSKTKTLFQSVCITSSTIIAIPEVLFLISRFLHIVTSIIMLTMELEQSYAYKEYQPRVF